MRQEGEPSVDQILRSIKKVMARDTERTSGAEYTAPDPADEDEAQEARELAEPEPTVGAADVSEPGIDPDEALELDADDLIEDEADGEADTAPAAASDSMALTSAAAAASVRRSLASLASPAEPSASQPTSAAAAANFENLTREMLRPILAQWLDANLAAIVEREVRAEIARIACAGQG